MIRDPVVIVSYVSLVQDRSTEMSAMTHFTRTVTTNYSLIMDANKNPLGRLPAAQRFQIMIYLAVMWTTIFCAALESVRKHAVDLTHFSRLRNQTTCRKDACWEAHADFHPML